MGDLQVRAKHSPNESNQDRQQYKENIQSIKEKNCLEKELVNMCVNLLFPA